MVTITLDLSEAKTFLRAQRAHGAAIGQQLMTWTRSLVVGVVNGLLKAELALVLDRERYERAETADANYRNGSRPRSFSLLGLGRLVFRVPRDRQGTFQTKLLPPRGGGPRSSTRSSRNCFSPGCRPATSNASA